MPAKGVDWRSLAFVRILHPISRISSQDLSERIVCYSRMAVLQNSEKTVILMGRERLRNPPDGGGRNNG